MDILFIPIYLYDSENGILLHQRFNIMELIYFRYSNVFTVLNFGLLFKKSIKNAGWVPPISIKILSFPLTGILLRFKNITGFLVKFPASSAPS